MHPVSPGWIPRIYVADGIRSATFNLLRTFRLFLKWLHGFPFPRDTTLLSDFSNLWAPPWGLFCPSQHTLSVLLWCLNCSLSLQVSILSFLFLELLFSRFLFKLQSFSLCFMYFEWTLYLYKYEEDFTLTAGECGFLCAGLCGHALVVVPFIYWEKLVETLCWDSEELGLKCTFSRIASGTWAPETPL